MIELADDKARLQIDRVHGWLASSYWSPGIARDRSSARSPGRIASAPITTASRSASRGDHRSRDLRLARRRVGRRGVRGQGLGRRLVGWFLDHPDLRATPDRAGHRRRARRVRGLGFHPLLRPERYMERLSPTSRDAAARHEPAPRPRGDRRQCRAGQPRARRRLRRRRADGGAARRRSGCRRARAGDRCRQRRRRGRARAVGGAGRCRCRPGRLSRRELRLCDPQPDAADDARARSWCSTICCGSAGARSSPSPISRIGACGCRCCGAGGCR